MSTNKFQVTLASLRKASACVEGYNKVVRTLQGKEFTDADMERETHIRFAHNEPISIRLILESNGIDDALWALRCINNADKDKDVRLFAVWCARQVEHLMEDKRSKYALDIAERHANGLATDGELVAASAAASAAAWDAASAAARDAASAAAWDAASAAASAAAWDAASVAASDAASAAAWDAARDAAMDAQKEKLIEMLDAGCFQS